jgi:hypothetical protein
MKEIMNKSENSEKEKQKKGRETKGAIFLAPSGSTLSCDDDTALTISDKTNINITNLRRIFAGKTNSTIETFEKCSEANGKRIVIFEVQDTSNLNLLLQKMLSLPDGNFFWKIPSNENMQMLSDFLLEILGISNPPQSVKIELFQLIAVLIAAANKVGTDNEELSSMMKRYRDEIVAWATKDNNDKE